MLKVDVRPLPLLFSSLFLKIVYVCVSMYAYACVQKQDEDIRYPPLLLAAYYFEAGSLPDSGASILSARLEARKFNNASVYPLRSGVAGIQRMLGYKLQSS